MRIGRRIMMPVVLTTRRTHRTFGHRLAGRVARNRDIHLGITEKKSHDGMAALVQGGRKFFVRHGRLTRICISAARPRQIVTHCPTAARAASAANASWPAAFRARCSCVLWFRCIGQTGHPAFPSYRPSPPHQTTCQAASATAEQPISRPRP